MATRTIGAAGDDLTPAAWSAYVKGLGTLLEDEVGVLIDDIATPFVFGDINIFDFSGVSQGIYTITLRADPSVKHNGDFGNGARFEGDASGSNFFTPKDVIFEDLSFYNTGTGSNTRVLRNCNNVRMNRCIIRCDSIDSNSQTINTVGSSDSVILNTCRIVTGFVGIDYLSGATNNACTNVTITGGATGFSFQISDPLDLINCVGYGQSFRNYANNTQGVNLNCAGDIAANNNSTNVVQLTPGITPFEADGYTPLPDTDPDGLLDGAGIDQSIITDAAGNPFAVPPSIGAYEVVSAGPPAPLFDGPIDDLNSVNGVPFSYDASVHFQTGGPVTSYSLQNAPAWMSISALGVISGTQNVDAVVTGLTVTGTGDTAPPAVSNTFTSNGNPAYADSVVYNCVSIPSDSILYYAAGTQDGGTSATVFTDSTASYTPSAFVDLIIENRTDGSRGVVTANDATTITVASLTGGTENDWDDGDVMAVVADIDNPDIIYYESPVSVVTESVDIDWYIYDDDTTIYSPLYTQTINELTNVADGSYTTSLDACGSITLTPVVLVPATLSNPTLVPTPGSTTSVDYSVTTDTVDGVMWLRYSLTFPQTDAWIKGGTSTPVTGTLFSGTTVGALPGETYYAYFLQETAAGDSNQQSAVTTMPLEIAVLTNEVADDPTFNTVTARVDTDQNGGDLRYLLNTSATAVEADLLGVGSRSQPVSQNVTQTITWSGAPTNTLVYVHFMQVTVGNSLVVSTAGVTTGEEVPVPPSSGINDAILIVTGGPTINDGLATWYGKTASETLPDAERRWLIEQGATSAHRNDMWFEFTGNLGYTGALPDRQLQYWLNGGAGSGVARVNFQGQPVDFQNEPVTFTED